MNQENISAVESAVSRLVEGFMSLEPKSWRVMRGHTSHLSTKMGPNDINVQVEVSVEVDDTELLLDRKRVPLSRAMQCAIFDWAMVMLKEKEAAEERELLERIESALAETKTDEYW